MNAEAFIAERRPRWVELEGGLERVNRGRVTAFSAADIERLALLYRRTVSDLALARREFPDEPISEYLNGLCGRAHVLLHRGSTRRTQTVWRFFLTGVPRTFRANLRYVAASLAVLVIGAIAGWLAYVLRPELRAVLVPQSAFDMMARGEHVDISPGVDSLGILANNIKVALVMFILGAALGLPTAFYLFLTGWMLGTLGASVHAGGYDLSFWSLIAAHGVLELSIIVISGAAGFRLGDAILRPGQRTRAQALRETALGISGMLVGIALLLVIAGFTEGFISPSGLPHWFKITWGLTLGVLFYGWLALAGRERQPVATVPSLEARDGRAALPMRRLPTAGDQPLAAPSVH
jgi:uncharacterized membrane protein SpoIIM required for sporulation